MELRHNPWKGSRDEEYEVSSCGSKCASFVVDRKLASKDCSACVQSARFLEFSRNALEWKPRYSREGRCSPSKLPFLRTDCNKTYTVCRERTLSSRCGLLGKSLQWKTRHSREGAMFSKKSVLHY